MTKEDSEELLTSYAFGDACRVKQGFGGAGQRY